MRSTVQSPFGTSLIDLLVGALALVALLWSINITNSGYSGTGDKDRTSAMVIVEQFGNTIHMETMTLSQPGRWRCEFRLRWTGTPVAVPESACKSDLGYAPPEYSSANTLKLPAESGTPEDQKPRLIWRLDKPPGNGYFVSLSITIENLTDRRVIADIGVEPCCDRHEPHYVRVLGLSGAGKSEVFTFWHAADRLTEVFKKDPKDLPWIHNFRDRIASGVITPRRTIFEPPAGKNCLHLQGNTISKPQISVVFEVEGDLRTTLPTSTGVSTEYKELTSDFDNLLSTYTSP